MLTVAGIDASTTKTGVSIMIDGELIYYTLIDLHKEKDAIKRVQNMMLKICEVLDQYDIDKVYMEKAFKMSNADTTIKLANLSGSIMLYCVQNKIEFNNPLPTEWRAKIGIEQSKKVKRDVLKAEAIQAVKQEYGIDVGDDEAESILIARSAFDLPKIGITEDDLWN
jgi:Holliday junction resolvasome RuvABC endonuclease subunit